MPTRTERLALPTIMAKLSRGKAWRKRKNHQQYNELFRDKFCAVRGYRAAYSTFMMKEWLAAINWPGYRSKGQAKLEALDHSDLMTLVVTIELGDAAMSVPEFIGAILALPSFNLPGTDPMADLSENSSKSMLNRSRSERPQKSSGRGSSRKSRTAKHRSSSANTPADAAVNATATPETAPSPSSSDSESFSSSSQSESSAEARPKTQQARLQEEHTTSRRWAPAPRRRTPTRNGERNERRTEAKEPRSKTALEAQLFGRRAQHLGGHGGSQKAGGAQEEK